MSVVSYPSNKQLSAHFNSSEFKCPHCGEVKLSTKLINKLEEYTKQGNTIEQRKSLFELTAEKNKTEKKEFQHKNHKLYNVLFQIFLLFYI